jgi:hypothetical protein
MPDVLASLTAPPSGRATPVWFDSLAYCREKLLSDEPVPWASPGELTAFTAKAQGMFRSDALLVDLAELYAWRGAIRSCAHRWPPAVGPDTRCAPCSQTNGRAPWRWMRSAQPSG